MLLLSDLKNLFEVHTQSTAMFHPLLELLKSRNIIDQQNDGSWDSIYGHELFSTLDSPEFYSRCPKVNKNLQVLLVVPELSEHVDKCEVASIGSGAGHLPEVAERRRAPPRNHGVHAGMPREQDRNVGVELRQSAASVESKPPTAE